MYKFISIEEYESTHKEMHPNARVSPDGNEVVISTNSHNQKNCTCLSHKDAIDYIETNWKYNQR